MKRIALTFGLSLTASLVAMVQAHEANACGGCFHPPTQTQSDITDERMLLSVSTKQTTLYDQIRYSGSPSSFAWVLPIHGTVQVGLSADVLFDSVDTLTATQIQAPAVTCPSLPSSCIDPSKSFFNADGSVTTVSGGAVDVSHVQNVGPYETVQLHATDSGALNDWLAKNGFEIPAAVTPIVDEYVKEGFDFLAMKLLPNQGVQAMRPVRVTMPGASTSLPLRMAAIGTGATVGITIWVVSDGRYEPQNFPFYHIEDSDLVWDFTASQSNYTTLRSTHEAELKGKGWEIESSIDVNQQTVRGTIYAGGINYGAYGGGGYQVDATGDYLPIGDADAGAATDGGVEAPYESADQVRDDDIAALFAGLSGPNVRITRMRSDIAHAAMDVDFQLQGSADQAELSNVRVVTQSINLQCPIYDNCQVVGTGTLEQANAAVANDDNTSAGDSGCAVVSTRKSDFARLSVLLGAVGLVGARLRRRRLRRFAKRR